MRSTKRIWNKVFGKYSVGDFVKVLKGWRTATKKTYYYGRITSFFADDFVRVRLHKANGQPYKKKIDIGVAVSYLENWKLPKRKNSKEGKN